MIKTDEFSLLFAAADDAHRKCIAFAEMVFGAVIEKQGNQMVELKEVAAHKGISALYGAMHRKDAAKASFRVKRDGQDSLLRPEELSMSDLRSVTHECMTILYRLHDQK